MKTMIGKSSPLKAWLKTLPVALGLPVILWILIWGISQWREPGHLHSSEITGSAIVLGVTVVVHFLAYAATGLPIFWIRYQKANSPIWIRSRGIPFGAALGAGVVFLLLGILDHTRATLLHPAPYLIGAGYGTATAIAALLQRPIPQ